MEGLMIFVRYISKKRNPITFCATVVPSVPHEACALEAIWRINAASAVLTGV